MGRCFRLGASILSHIINRTYLINGCCEGKLVEGDLLELLRNVSYTLRHVDLNLPELKSTHLKVIELEKE